jgi:hypothetical protein
MLYKAEVYDPTLDMGRDQYWFYFHFDEYAPRRWSSDHARHISWWIASKLLEGDESVTPGITKGMLVYLNLVTEDLHALPTRMFPICEGITIGIGLSPDFLIFSANSMPRIVTAAVSNRLNPSIGRMRCLIRR